MSYSLLNRSRVRGEFFRRLAIDMHASAVSAMAIDVRGEGDATRFGFSGAVPAFKKWGGKRGAKAMQAYKVDVTHEIFDAAVTVRARDARRDQTGSWNRAIADLAKQAAVLKWKLLSDLIKNGATAGNNSYDGQTFFDTDHLLGKSGTQKNKLTATEVPALNIADTDAPTAVEMVDAIVGCASYMYRFLDDEGNPLNETARHFLAIVPSNIVAAAATAVNANFLAGGVTNLITAMAGGNGGQKFKIEIDILPDPRQTIADPSVFWVACLDGSAPPFVIAEELPMELQYWDEDSDFYKDTFELKVGGKWEGNAGYGEPLSIVHATFS